MEGPNGLLVDDWEARAGKNRSNQGHVKKDKGQSPVRAFYQHSGFQKERVNQDRSVSGFIAASGLAWCK
jgi:hypothetical protein